MSVTNPTADAPDPTDPPEYNLEYRYDDVEDPSEVTVYPTEQNADITTEWITVETGDTFALEEVR